MKLERDTSPDGTRIYKTPSGKAYPSVTTVTGLHNAKGITEWRRRVGEEEANKISSYATSFGTAIHKIIEDYINNKESFLDFAKPQEKWVFNAAQNYLDKIDGVYCQEGCLYSDVLQLAGRTDCIAEYEGIPSVIDFKTARKAKEEAWIKSYFLQATAYSLMFEELTGISVPQIVIILMTYSGEVTVFKKQRKDYYEDLKEVIYEDRRNQSSHRS